MQQRRRNSAADEPDRNSRMAQSENHDAERSSAAAEMVDPMPTEAEKHLIEVEKLNDEAKF